MAQLAFIGLGNMGGGMAANLVKAGFEVCAFDLSPAALQGAVEAGCTAAASAAEAVANADFVVSMLPNGAIVESIYIDDPRDSSYTRTPTPTTSSTLNSKPKRAPTAEYS